MTYENYLRMILLEIDKNKDRGDFKGLCAIILSFSYLKNEFTLHRHHLRKQIREDKCEYYVYLDRSFKWRVKHGNFLPYCLLTPTMRNNMRISYIKSLIAKEV